MNTELALRTFLTPFLTVFVLYVWWLIRFATRIVRLWIEQRRITFRGLWWLAPRVKLRRAVPYHVWLQRQRR